MCSKSLQYIEGYGAIIIGISSGSFFKDWHDRCTFPITRKITINFTIVYHSFSSTIVVYIIGEVFSNWYSHVECLLDTLHKLHNLIQTSQHTYKRTVSA